MQETRPPEGANLKEAFVGPDGEAVVAKMDDRLAELQEERHELVQRASITMPQGLIMEILRCEKLLEADGSRMNKASLRSALGQARDSLGKFERVKKKVLRSLFTLQEFK